MALVFQRCILGDAQVLFLKHKHHLQHMGNIMGFHGILCKEWDKNPHIFMGDEDPLWVNPCDLTIDTNMGMAQNLSEIH